MNKGITAGLVFCAAAVTAGIVSWKIATDDELRGKIARNFKDAMVISKRKIYGMSEDVAMRTAQMTRNPKVNQEWVSQQWETLGL